MRYTYLDSPLGALLVVRDESGLSGLYLPSGRHPVTVAPEWVRDDAAFDDVRTQLEGHAAYRAAQRVTEVQRAEIQELLEELPESQGSGDVVGLMELDARVHRLVYRCAGNPYLEETLGRYFNLSLRIWYLVIDRLPHLFARVHEHDDLLRAILAGDAQRARETVAEHIATFEREVRAVL